MKFLKSAGKWAIGGIASIASGMGIDAISRVIFFEYRHIRYLQDCKKLGISGCPVPEDSEDGMEYPSYGTQNHQENEKQN